MRAISALANNSISLIFFFLPLPIIQLSLSLSHLISLLLYTIYQTAHFVYSFSLHRTILSNFVCFVLCVALCGKRETLWLQLATMILEATQIQRSVVFPSVMRCVWITFNIIQLQNLKFAKVLCRKKLWRIISSIWNGILLILSYNLPFFVSVCCSSEKYKSSVSVWKEQKKL